MCIQSTDKLVFVSTFSNVNRALAKTTSNRFLKNIFAEKFPREIPNHERNDNSDDGKSGEIILLVDQTQIGYGSICLGRCECSLGDLLMNVRGCCAGCMPLFFRIEQFTDHREFCYGCDSNTYRFAQQFHLHRHQNLFVEFIVAHVIFFVVRNVCDENCVLLAATFGVRFVRIE